MEDEFTLAMSKRTDEELIKIVTIDRDKYQTLGVKAAELEIEKRSIDTSDFDRIREEARAIKEEKDKIDSYLAGTGTRFLNFLIDFIVFLLLAFIISFIGGMLIPTTNEGIITLIFYILFFGTFIAYFSIMEIKFQKTIGKFVTKTHVVKLNGEKPENSEIISRTFCRLIPFDRISFIFFKNGIHDLLSKTIVVKDKMKE